MREECHRTAVSAGTCRRKAAAESVNGMSKRNGTSRRTGFAGSKKKRKSLLFLASTNQEAATLADMNRVNRSAVRGKRTTGNHLRFGVYVNDAAVDPAPCMR
jgi:hypothetical protein